MARFEPTESQQDLVRNRAMRSRLGRLLAFAGGLAAVVASFQPWIVADTQQGPVTVLGVDRYGSLTLIAGVVVIVMAALPPRPLGTWRRRALILASASIPISAMWDPTGVYQYVNGEYVRGAIQPALWVTAASGIVALAGAMLVPPPPPERPELPPWPVRPRPKR
jgi:hypothetical protein